MEKNFDEFLAAYQKIKTEERKSFAVVTVVQTRGSAPQDQGARMIATPDGVYFGTIGGGKVEARALLLVKENLNSKSEVATKNEFVKWNLQKDIGMTCGGEVSLFFEFHPYDHPWTLAVFGAGHVSQELNWLLAKIDCQVICVDPRPEWLGKLPDHARLVKICTSDMANEVAKLPEKSFLVLMTMGHSTDLPILFEALKRDFPYVGVIGSLSKANRIKKDLKEAGFSAKQMKKYLCPIGEDFGNNSPIEIAVSTVAQLIRYRDKI